MDGAGETQNNVDSIIGEERRLLLWRVHVGRKLFLEDPSDRSRSLREAWDSFETKKNAAFVQLIGRWLWNRASV